MHFSFLIVPSEPLLQTIRTIKNLLSFSSFPLGLDALALDGHNFLDHSSTALQLTLWKKQPRVWFLSLCLFALLPHADAAVDWALEVLSSRLPALIFEEVALDTRDIQETPALDLQVSMVVLFNISFYSSNVMLSVTSYYPPLRILCNIKEREGSYYRGGRSSPLPIVDLPQIEAYLLEMVTSAAAKWIIHAKTSL